MAGAGNQEPTKKQATFEYNFSRKHIKEQWIKRVKDHLKVVSAQGAKDDNR